MPLLTKRTSKPSRNATHLRPTRSAISSNHSLITEWRLFRIPSLEMGIYAVGRLELASNFQEIEDPQARAALIEAKVYLTYQRQLNNLSIQEGRLIKQRDKALAELDRLQKLRARETYAALSRATDLYAQARKLGRGLQSAMNAGLLGRIAA